jgi:3-hydroxyisobutyrate dehydrogenase
MIVGVPQMGEHDFTLKWRVKTVLKDLEGANNLERELGSDAPMLQLGSQLMGVHGGHGYLEKDLSTLVMQYEDE